MHRLEHARRSPNDRCRAERRCGSTHRRPIATSKSGRFIIARISHALLDGQIVDGTRSLGYGPSTNDNVLLQFCGISEKHLAAIAEFSTDPFGAFMLRTLITRVSEADAWAMKPDYVLVLR